MELANMLKYLGISVAILAVLFVLWRFIARLRSFPAQQRRIEEEQEARSEAEQARREKALRQEEERRHLEALEAEERRRVERRREEAERQYQERERELAHLSEIGRDRQFAGREPVRFHTLWHRRMRPEVWQTLLVYVFSGPNGLFGAQRDFLRRKTASADSYEDSSSMARRQIPRGTEISVYPELSGVRFNPPFANVLWLEEWHCIEFRMQALEQFEPTEGRVAFFVGPILIGETRLHATTTDEAERFRTESPSDDSFWEETWTSPYRAIFVSYSHEDTHIVDKLELAYRALGDEYLRDIAVLRSGDKWNPALLEKIKQANIFQLCWSESAKQSQYVEEEWRYALNLCRSRFIRPMYWDLPMPTPPDELSDIHFAYVRI